MPSSGLMHVPLGARIGQHDAVGVPFDPAMITRDVAIHQYKVAQRITADGSDAIVFGNLKRLEAVVQKQIGADRAADPYGFGQKDSPP